MGYHNLTHSIENETNQMWPILFRNSGKGMVLKCNFTASTLPHAS